MDLQAEIERLKVENEILWGIIKMWELNYELMKEAT